MKNLWIEKEMEVFHLTEEEIHIEMKRFLF